MESQLHILLKVLNFTVYVFFRVIPALMLCNIFLEMGLMNKLKPLGKMFTRVAHLPPEVSLPFISSFGSSYAGGAIVVGLHEKRSYKKYMMTVKLENYFAEKISR